MGWVLVELLRRFLAFVSLSLSFLFSFVRSFFLSFFCDGLDRASFGRFKSKNE